MAEHVQYRGPAAKARGSKLTPLAPRCVPYAAPAAAWRSAGALVLIRDVTEVNVAIVP